MFKTKCDKMWQSCVRKQISSSHVTLFSFLTYLNLWKSGVHMWKSKFHMISWTFFLFPQVEFLIHIGKCMKKSSSRMTLIPFHMINISLHVRIQIDMWQNIVAHESIHMCNIWSWLRKCSLIWEKANHLWNESNVKCARLCCWNICSHVKMCEITYKCEIHTWRSKTPVPCFISTCENSSLDMERSYSHMSVLQFTCGNFVRMCHFHMGVSAHMSVLPPDATPRHLK